jgi:cephalosporin hydroxylase
MHHSAYINAEKFKNKYIDNIKNKKILDIGSYDVNGTMKPIFNEGVYIGLDMEKGPNVDVVSDAHNIPFQNEYFDVVLSSSCFEHDDMFWETFLEMCRVVNPGGYLYIQAPSNGPYHGWPGDNWRFYIDSWKALERWGRKNNYDIELIDHYIDETTPPSPNEGDRIWNDSVAIYRKKQNKVFDVSLKSIENGHLRYEYRGVPTHKCPFDYVLYQMIINEVKPDLIIEIGTFKGGSSLYYADLMNNIGHGEIHTINIYDDVNDQLVINHPRIKRFFDGYQNYDITQVKNFDKIIVIDDGSHNSQDVLAAFKKFESLVTLNSYYIIEDGILSELGYNDGYDGGPLKVMDSILEYNNKYIIDRKWCDFFGYNATFNPDGFLKRIL